VQRHQPGFPRLDLRKLGNQNIEVMIEAGLDVMVKEEHADELLGRLLAVVSGIVIVVRGEQLRGFRVLLREVEERPESIFFLSAPRLRSPFIDAPASMICGARERADLVFIRLEV
jgi:hypothetical protein